MDGRILEHFEANALPAYIVGGALRDLLLGRPLRDIDLLVLDDAKAHAESIAKISGGSCFVLDEQRDVARIVWQGREAATGRGDIAQLDIARIQGPDISTDLRARDFTINSMALPLDRMGASGSQPESTFQTYDLAADALIDPLGGLDDLHDRVLRPSSPRALMDDPLRILRAVRISTQLNFEISEQLRRQIRATASRVLEPAGERIRDELLLMITGVQNVKGILLLEELGLLQALLPELDALHSVPQSIPHDRNVFHHSISTMEAAAHFVDSLKSESSQWPAFWDTAGGQVHLYPELMEPLQPYRAGLRGHFWDESNRIEGRPRALWFCLAALLHDIGKSECHQYDSARERHRFLGHAEAGAERMKTLIQRLRLGRDAGRYLMRLTEHHLRPLHLSFSAETPTGRDRYIYFRECGDMALDVCLHSILDNGAKSKMPRAQTNALGRVLRRLIEDHFNPDQALMKPQLPLEADELLTVMNLEPGPMFGALIGAIKEEIAAGEVEATKDSILAFSRSWLAERQG